MKIECERLLEFTVIIVQCVLRVFNCDNSYVFQNDAENIPNLQIKCSCSSEIQCAQIRLLTIVSLYTRWSTVSSNIRYGS